MISWVEMVDSAKAEAEAKGIQLEVLCPLTADSNEEQIQLVEQALLGRTGLLHHLPRRQRGSDAPQLKS